jgi:hypothetical protein
MIALCNSNENKSAGETTLLNYVIYLIAGIHYPVIYDRACEVRGSSERETGYDKKRQLRINV